MSRRLLPLGLALLVVLTLAVRWTTPGDVADLRPRPDALEYEEAARRLARGDGYWLEIDGGRHPPRYPPGFPLLLAPVLALAGDEPGTGIVVVLAAAVLAVVATVGLGTAAGGPIVGVAAGLLLALAPLHVRWSRAVMADVPASAAIALLAWWGLAALSRRRGGTALWLALGIATGLAASLRPVVGGLVLPLGAILAARGAVPALAALGFGTGLGLLPQIALAVARFGKPHGTGYEYWEGAAFGLGFVTGLPHGGGATPNLVFYTRELLGLGQLYPPTTAALLVVGAVIALRAPGTPRRLLAITLGVLTALLALHLPFFWQWNRFLLPALPLCCALAALPLRTDTAPALRASAALLVLISVAWPLAVPNAFAPPDPDRREVAALRLVADRLPADAALIVRTHPFVFDRVVRGTTDRVWVPVGRDEHRAAIARRRLQPFAPATDDARWMRPTLDVPFDPDAAAAQIAALLADGRPVYYTPLLDFTTAPEPALQALLAERFVLEPADPTRRLSLQRVRARTPAT